MLRATDRSNRQSIGTPIEQFAIPIHAHNLGILTIDGMRVCEVCLPVLGGHVLHERQDLTVRAERWEKKGL